MSKEVKHLSLALQGGGAHGAFTWGVLDRLLEQENLVLDGFVGTSAGAMNASVLAYGLHIGGREKARELLHTFWKSNSDYASRSPLQPTWMDGYFGVEGNMDYSPFYRATEVMSLFMSPYQFNPSHHNPLRKILGDIVNFEELRKCKVTKLYVCATNVRRGRAKVFDLSEMSIEAVLASACLPTLFPAITIDGEDYWDGGYMGNPPIFPLISNDQCHDIMLVQINPINIPTTPTTPEGIRDRINELSFNSSLMLEMRRVAFVDRLLKEGINLDNEFQEIRMHNINPEEDIWDLNLSSKLNASWKFLTNLRDMGRKYADQWLAKNLEHVGKKSTCDIRKTFL